VSGETWDKVLAVACAAAGLAFLVKCATADAAEEPVMPPLSVAYSCPTGDVLHVASNHPDVHIAHLMVMIGRITPDQYIALLTSITPDFEPAAHKFLIECFGQGV